MDARVEGCTGWWGQVSIGNDRKKNLPWSLIWTVLLLWFWSLYFSPCTGSPTPIKKKLVEKHLGLFPTLEASTDKVIQTADDSLLEIDKTSYLQKPWLMRLNQYWKKHAMQGKTLNLLQPSFLSKMWYDRKRGPFYLSSFPVNLRSFKHFLFCPPFVHNMEIQELSGIGYI